MTAHLRVMLLPDRKTEFIDVADDESLDGVLQEFLDRTGRFEGEWVPLRSSPEERRFVRYDQVVLVEATPH